MKTTLSNIIKTSLFSAGLTLATLGAGAADAFTLNYDPQFGTTNNDAITGATAAIDFTFTDLGNGDVQLDLNISNTTADPVTSELVGIGFDWTGGDLAAMFGFAAPNVTGSTYDGGSSNLDLLYADDSINGQAKDPDGNVTLDFNSTTFDIGLGISSTLMSSGSPRDGVDAGTSTSVSFNLKNTGYTAASLEQFFVDGFSNGSLITAARFKAIEGGTGATSDKLVGGVLSTTPPSTPDADVPEPGTILALGSVAFGAMGLRRKKEAEANA